MNSLLQDLESRINPEKNRKFAPEEFGRRLKLLEAFVDAQWPEKNGWRFSVVGTNGKGSVSHYLGSILQRSGFDTGLYTSPHLNHFSERIRINGEPVDEASLEKHYLTLQARFLASAPGNSGRDGGLTDPPEKETGIQAEARDGLWKDLSYFELLTLLALEIFQSQKPGAQIYEAGLGGRLDATRLNDPEVVIVTKIALDHTSLLGNTREAILREKLGICGPATKHLFLMEGRYETVARDFLASRASMISRRSANLPASAVSLESEPGGMQPAIHIFPADAGHREDHYLKQNYQFAAWILRTLEKGPGTPGERNPNAHPGDGNPEALRNSPGEAESDRTRKPFSIPATRSAFSDPPGRLSETTKHGLRWIYDSGHNPASLHAVLKNALWQGSAPLLVLGILPDRSYRQFFRVARLHGISRTLCIRRNGLASIPESVGDDDILDALDSPSENLRRIHKICKDSGLTAVLFTGSYRIYDLFLEILGGDIVHA